MKKFFIAIFHLREAYMNMDKPFQRPRSHLFTVRVWKEEVRNGHIEWRGKVQLVNGGDVRYFREWAALVPLLLAMLSELDSMSELDK
jgi:hypothetical protein